MEAPINRSPLFGPTTPTPHHASSAAASSMPDDSMSLAVKRFASLLSTKGQQAKEQRPTNQLLSMFAKSTADDEVVLIVPSLDLRLEEDSESSASSVLPGVGKHAESSSTSTDEPMEEEEEATTTARAIYR